MRVTQTAISVQAKTGPRLYAGAFAACLIVSSSRVVACSKQLAMTGAAVKEMSVDARASDTEKEAGNGAAGAAEESGGAAGDDVVDWAGDDDVEKPLNWAKKRKVKQILVICYNTFLT
jgi:hypothetical protein